jgi:hypothetical protein
MDDKLTREYLLGLITKTSFQYRGTTTICTLDIDGFPVAGESHCVFRDQYNKQVGEKVSYENALKQLRRFEEYAQRKTVKAD